MATARLLAVRASEPTCTATAASPANIRPDAVKVLASTSVGTAPPPTARVSRKQTTPSATDAMAAIATATASRDSRAITPEATSSAWPESSSARLLRTTTRIVIRPEKNAPRAPARQALNPSAVERSRAGPKIRDRAGFAPRVRARSVRSWGSGKTIA